MASDMSSEATASRSYNRRPIIQHSPLPLNYQDPYSPEESTLEKPRPSCFSSEAPKPVQLSLPGPHCAWGQPILLEHPPERPTSHFQPIPVPKEDDTLEQPKDNYSIPPNLLNPPGWFDQVKSRRPASYVTMNSSYGSLPPNPYTMSVIHRARDQTFTKRYSGFPIYRNRSLNTE